MSAVPRRFGHVGITTHELERLVDFYCEIVGLTVSDRMPYPEGHRFTEGVWLRCGNDHHAVSAFGLRDPAEPRAGPHHLAFEMESLDALKGALRRVRERGVRMDDMRRGGPGVQLRLYFFDPDDNIVELYWDLDQIGWDGRTRPYPPVESIDIEDFDEESWFAWKRSLA